MKRNMGKGRKGQQMKRNMRKCRKRRQMKRKWGTRAIFLTGFLLCCLPTFNNVIEQRRQADAVATYQKTVDKMEEKVDGMLAEAKKYNDMLYQSEGILVDGTDILSDRSYQNMLNISGTGIMGSLDIPKIHVELPIYHGTANESLSGGVGHLQGTSLPVGGANTHSVLSGHRGLPSSKLLVRLDEMQAGDLFFIRLGNETLAYKVCDIQIVEPDDTTVMRIEREKDLVSLVTCTPYGINTHRLVVTGERAEYSKAGYDSIEQGVPSVREILLSALPFLFIVIAIAGYIKNRREDRKKGQEEVK